MIQKKTLSVEITREERYTMLLLEAAKRWSMAPDYTDIHKNTGFSKPRVFQVNQKYGTYE